MYQFDLLECPAVAQLRTDPQQAPTFQLLSIMLSGDVQARLTLTNPLRGTSQVQTCNPVFKNAYPGTCCTAMWSTK